MNKVNINVVSNKQKNMKKRLMNISSLRLKKRKISDIIHLYKT